MKKIILLVIVILTGCSISETQDLKGLYLSISSTDENLKLTNLTYDFDNEKYTEEIELKLSSKYSLTVCDYKENVVYYTAKDSKELDQIYRYDIEGKETTQLSDCFYAINYIIPREKDIFIVGVLAYQENWVIQSFLLNKETLELEVLNFPIQGIEDFTTWVAATVPESNDIIIQGYSQTEEIKKTDIWNSQTEKEKSNPDVDLKTYFCILKENSKDIDVLFDREMPQSYSMVSNGRSIVYSVNRNQGDEYYIYDIHLNEERKLGVNQSIFNNMIYLDSSTKYLYYIDKNIKKIDVDTFEIEDSNSDFEVEGDYYNNFMIFHK